MFLRVGVLVCQYDMNKGDAMTELTAAAATLYPTARVVPSGDCWEVEVTWHGAPLDRPDVGGFLLRNRKTALRLAKAVEAGVVYLNPQVAVDNAGKTYVRAHSCLLARQANAFLTQMGF